MIYCKEISIPANTLVTIPITEQIDVVEGIIKRVWVRWRWGSADLGGCSIYRGGFQVWPTTLRQWFTSTVFDTVFDEQYILNDEPLHFVIRAYNKDTMYPHKVWVGFSVLRPKYTAGILEWLEFMSSGTV